MEFGNLDLKKNREYIEYFKLYVKNSVFFKNCISNYSGTYNNLFIVSVGTRNINYHIEIKGVEYILRIVLTQSNSNILDISYYREQKINYLANIYNIDSTFININVNDGTKISKYINNSHELNLNNDLEVKKAIILLKKFHDIPTELIVDKFNYKKYCVEMDKKIFYFCQEYYPIYNDIYKNIKYIYEDIEPIIDNKICHLDCHCGNFLIDECGNINLIDFEFSNVFDSRFDIASFCVNANMNIEERYKIYQIYYNYDKNINHQILEKFCLINAFYNLQWGIFVKMCGINSDNYVIQNIKFILRNIKK